MLGETIDLDVVGEALKTEIHVASASSAITGKRKRLSFTTDDSTYHFFFKDKHSETTVKHKHPADAIEVYNRFEVMK